MDAKNLYDGISRLLETSSAARELPKPVNNGKAKGADENGDVLAAAKNGGTPTAKESEAINADEVVMEEVPIPETEQEHTNNTEKPMNDSVTS
ncbi:hypothetical protein S83_069738 [Arachis hypogaea]